MSRLNSKTPYPIFHRSLVSIALIIILSCMMIYRGDKEKSQYNHLTGKITFLDDNYDEYPFRNAGKYRYLRIDTYPKTFEIFVGKDKGDFNPDYENLDALKLNDEIQIYFENPFFFIKADPKIDKLIQFIEMEDQSYYIRGDSDRIIGYFCLSASLLMLILIFELKRRGTII